ncbi:hypothetical protein INT48_003861 [Thamnidium elegans]|uniref:N-acetyltransferase domain-containing protein n=1 Tax=Thamnidium elegans TaxID=101142 RepID=A0A8H7SE83_9FUNG|nr:hypothetical protein INT48_003861 [Thamnidium elegans]
MVKPLLYGDTFGTFHCSICNEGQETFQRKGLSWIAIVHLVIYNLIKKAQIEDAKKDEKDRREHYYFRWKEDVCAFIDDYWDYLVPDKQRSLTWNNTIASVLSTHNNLFLSGFEKFHQSAWWTLHKVEPPSNEKKSKATTKQKPNLKRPLKRSKPDPEPPKPKKPKKIKKEDPDPDLLDLSSLSELSSANELSSDEELQPVKKKKTDTKKPASRKLSLDKMSPEILSPRTATSSPSSEHSLKPKQTKSQPSKFRSSPKPTSKLTASSSSPSLAKQELETVQSKPSPSPSPPPSPTAAVTVAVTVAASPLPRVASSSQLTSTVILPENVDPVYFPKITLKDISRESSVQQESPTTETHAIKEEKCLDIPNYAPNTAMSTGADTAANTQKNTSTHTNTHVTTIATKPHATSVYSHHLSQQDEWLLLQRLEHSSKKLSYTACRYKRKLAVRRLKRNLGIKLFDIDAHIIQLLRTPKHALEPISKETTILPASNQEEEQSLDDQQQRLDKITFTPYTSSFASRLFGSIRQRETITRDEPWLSSWNGRKLRPFIRRDFQSKPNRMLLMGQIKACNGKPCKKGEKVDGVVPGESIDYVYFQKEHLAQVNLLLSRSFWEGIDVSESLLFPEFSIVALYKRHVIGCAFMTPEAYITYFAVDEGWGKASIGQFMLYHLFQTAISKDITLHVSANNNAMILYQKFGFKPEEFIVNFYDKYYPADSVYSKNAFFLRLRR